jgi:hypothetical protein
MGERWIEKVEKGIRKKKETGKKGRTTPKENEGKKEETVTRESERKRERERVFCASRGWQAITFAYKPKVAEILCHKGSGASL